AKVSIDQPEDWDVHLDRVLLAYRSSVHHTTGATPCRIIFGRELRLPVDVVYGLPQGMQAETTGVYVQRLRRELEQVFDTVRAKAKLEQRRQKLWRDKRAHGHAYEPGDQVWLQVPMKTKLGAHWEGPYLVQKKLDWNTYRLRKIRGGKEPVVVHFDRLKPYHDRQQIAETWEVGRKRRTTRRPAWLRDFICTKDDQEGVRWDVIIISNNGDIVVFVRDIRWWSLLLLRINPVFLFSALSARMLPTKRELGKRGGRAGSNRTDDTDAEMNPQVNTGASSFGDDCGSNPVE
ncbi:Retrovirus-related Pol polyprotein from transposon, partial [Trichinella nelsoni]